MGISERKTLPPVPYLRVPGYMTIISDKLRRFTDLPKATGLKPLSLELAHKFFPPSQV